MINAISDFLWDGVTALVTGVGVLILTLGCFTAFIIAPFVPPYLYFDLGWHWSVWLVYIPAAAIIYRLEYK